MGPKLLTLDKLADHFRVSREAMRDALIEHELYDEYLEAPTAEGHLLAGAEVQQLRGRAYATEQRWCQAKVGGLFPELAENVRAAKYSTYRTRWKAAEAMSKAGYLLADHLKAPDRDVFFLMTKNITLFPAHSAGLLADYSADTLQPIIRRLTERLAAQGKSEEPEVIEAMSILNGLEHWASGQELASAACPAGRAPFELVPEPVVRDIRPDSLGISSQERELLERGYTFVSQFAESPALCFLETVKGLMIPNEPIPQSPASFVRMTSRGRHRYLVLGVLAGGDSVPSVWKVDIRSDGRLYFIEQQDHMDFAAEFLAIISFGKRNHAKARISRVLDRKDAELDVELRELEKRDIDLAAQEAELREEVDRDKPVANRR